MKILIVDDSNEKIAGIVEVIKETINEDIKVETVLDSISAQRKLKKHNFDLLIIDLLLPIRDGEEPIKEGGKQLVNEIERKDHLNSPKYIVGTTQYEDYLDLFPDIWTTLYYENSTKWKNKLKRVIAHIGKVDFNVVESNKPQCPSIIVEGLTDNKILSESIQIFKPDLKHDITIKADKNAGAKWVSNQIVAWAHSMVGGTKNKIKAVGILDGDKAGINAKEEVSRIIKTNSAKREVFKLITLSPDYARDLIPLHAQGLLIPITLEELFPPFIWSIADDKGWLKERPHNKIILENPNDWNQRKQSLDEYISTLELDDKQELYLKTFKIGSKREFVDFICNLDQSKKKKALKNFKKLLCDIESYLFSCN